jgi:HlyD family secretion protein
LSELVTQRKGCLLPSQHSLARHSLIGYLLIFGLFGTLAAWAFTTEIAGAIIAHGIVVVSSETKKVQHPTGGVVREILVSNGSMVKKGQLLVILDETVLSANLALISKSLAELMARKARLVAERDYTTRIEAAALQEIAPEITAQAIKDEEALFERRRAVRQSIKSQLGQRVQQSTDELTGLQAQLDAKIREIELVSGELKGASALWNKALMPITKYNALQREAARLGGERGQLLASIALANAKMIETQLKILQIDDDLGSEVGKELRDVDYRINELVERRVAAQDQLHRTKIVAPKAGIVHELAAHTVGGVIGAGDTLMLIVPQGEALAAEVRVRPQDIDQLRRGQEALLRFSAFNQSMTPDCPGKLRHIAADLSLDSRNGAAFYVVRIDLSTLETGCLAPNALLPGMPVEAFMKVSDRTVWSYFTKPLSDHMARAFRAD